MRRRYVCEVYNVHANYARANDIDYLSGLVEKFLLADEKRSVG